MEFPALTGDPTVFGVRGTPRYISTLPAIFQEQTQYSPRLL